MAAIAYNIHGRKDYAEVERRREERRRRQDAVMDASATYIPAMDPYRDILVERRESLSIEDAGAGLLPLPAVKRERLNPDVLWRCFALHSMADHPHECNYMNILRFVQLMSSCKLPQSIELGQEALQILAISSSQGARMEKSMSSRLFENFSIAKNNLSTKGRKLSFPDFLDALVAIAQIIYGERHSVDDTLAALLHEYVYPAAYQNDSRLPFGTSGSEAASFVSCPAVKTLLEDFAPSLHAVFTDLPVPSRVSPIKAGRFAGKLREKMTYQEYHNFVVKALYLQHNKRENVLSAFQVGQIFVAVKEGAGSDPGETAFIIFDEFLMALALLARAVAESRARMLGLSYDDVCPDHGLAMKSLFLRMSRSPSVMDRKMRCFVKFKRRVAAMRMEDGQPGEYLWLRRHEKKPQKGSTVLRRMSASFQDGEQPRPNVPGLYLRKNISAIAKAPYRHHLGGGWFVTEDSSTGAPLYFNELTFETSTEPPPLRI